jgi:hypothetical protein
MLPAVLCLLSSVSAQQRTTKPAAQDPIVFAVLNDGKMVEPIGSVSKGKVVPAVGGDAELADKTAFAKKFYRTGAKYELVFAGSRAGTVTVRSADPASECTSNMAEVSVASTRTTLKGKVMALATDLKISVRENSVRRMPTKEERAAAEALVKAEFRKQGSNEADLRTLDYHNLTAIDVDGDGKVELVGSYWVKPNTKTRRTLFFIADQAVDGKFGIGFGKYNEITEENVMGGDIAAIDQGIYHELLLDSLDIDRDGVNEIFSYSQSFEGAGFSVYRRANGKWNAVFEVSNYHCGF